MSGLRKKRDGSTFSFYLVDSKLLVGAAVILVAPTVLLLATGYRAGGDLNRALLTAINAVIVSLATMEPIIMKKLILILLLSTAILLLATSFTEGELPTDPFTWEQLATIACATLAMFLIVQLLKLPLDLF